MAPEMVRRPEGARPAGEAGDPPGPSSQVRQASQGDAGSSLGVRAWHGATYQIADQYWMNEASRLLRQDSRWPPLVAGRAGRVSDGRAGLAGTGEGSARISQC